MTATNKLAKITYAAKDIELEAYADILVIDEMQEQGATICAVRLAHYPEMVQGMIDALRGGGKVEVLSESGEATLHAAPSGYKCEISHNGYYAEAWLVARDDPKKPIIEESNISIPAAAEESNNVGRQNCYFLCKSGDPQELFENLDQRLSIPLIPEFAEYLIRELKQHGILVPLQVNSLYASFHAWKLTINKDEEEIIAIVEQGLHSGEIAVPGAYAGCFSPLDEISSMSQYLEQYGADVTTRIKDTFNPLFSPATEPLSPEILRINDFVYQKVGYRLYDAQLAAAEAIKRQLERNKVALLVAECGVGKTKIATSAVGALWALHATSFSKTFNIVLGPSHMKNKWRREIEETLDKSYAVLVRNNAELDAAYRTYQRGNRSCYVVLSKESARDGYMKMPAVRWNKLKKGFACPDCGTIITCKGEEDVEINAPPTFFKREKQSNHRCPECGTPLWQPVNPEQKSFSHWAKLSDYGFVYRFRADEYRCEMKTAHHMELLEQLVQNPYCSMPAVGARRTFPLANYIRKNYRGKLDGLLIDELHQYNNKSAQGDAMGSILQAANKAVGMTATLINGYSSGLFYLLYRIAPSLMLMDGQKYEEPVLFDRQYGVVQDIVTVETQEYQAKSRTRTGHRVRQLPGMSPLVYARFLLDSAVYLSLADLGQELPDYEEIPYSLDMTPAVAAEYERLEDQFIKLMKGDKRVANKVLSACINLLIAYPDQPYGHKPIINPFDGKPLIIPKDIGGPGDRYPKDSFCLEYVKDKIADGQKVLIYTNWTRLDAPQKLLGMLGEQGIQASIMRSKIQPARREDWVQERLRFGDKALILNPSLVETGLDLNEFTALFFYDTGNKLFTFRQSARRSYRINQKAPRVEVALPFYGDSMQHKWLRLMASKLAVATLIEGNFTDEGLAQMSDITDNAAILAKELLQGLPDDAEELTSAFQRMAIINPDRNKQVHDDSAHTDLDDSEQPMQKRELSVAQTATLKTIAPISFDDLREQYGQPQKKRPRKKSSQIPDGYEQPALFDISA